MAKKYETFIIYFGLTPLIRHDDIEQAYQLFITNSADILVTLKIENHRLWKESRMNIDSIETVKFDDEKPILIEVNAFKIIRANAINGQVRTKKIIPYYLKENIVEIKGHDDWWVCEKLLKRKKIVFVVSGYPAIGMGHIFRSLTLAHDINDHEIYFLCTKNSDLAALHLAEKDYPTIMQSTDLLEDVLNLQPDLVINDILDTDYNYIKGLKDRGIKVINFEDMGSGSKIADLVVNALYEPNGNIPENHLYGYNYFCLRDEFLGAKKRSFRHPVKNLLILFGGTDPNNYSMHTIDAILDMCKEKNIFIYCVTGPGYLYKEELELYLRKIGYDLINYTHKTGVVSSIMEKVDLAIASAGRTVYELAHMHIPAIIMAQNKREELHAFARPENGFEYIGYMNPFNYNKLIEKFKKMLDMEYRRLLFDRMKRFHFERNKPLLVKRILSLLDEE